MRLDTFNSSGVPNSKTPPPTVPADRDEMAEWVLTLAPLVRYRVRRRLSRRAQRLFDSQDLLSTLLRRVDKLLVEGEIRATSDEQLIALLMRIVENAVIDRERVLDRLTRATGPDQSWANEFAQRLSDKQSDTETGDVLADVFDDLEDPNDRLLLTLWLRGMGHQSSASILGCTHAAARQRWVGLKTRIRDSLASRLA